METAEASSPAHITGFFQICNKTPNLLSKGSKGAGISLKRGVKTRVHVEKSLKNSIEIRFNGKNTQDAQVSNFITEKFLKKYSNPLSVKINHTFDIPIGVGLGSSGAGALSLAFALNEVLDLDLSKIEAAQEAHVAEICCRTGLGTVIAEYFGGLELRLKPGAPGIGVIQQIPVQEDYVVVCLSLDSIQTRKSLADESLRNIINNSAPEYIKKLAEESTLDNFLAFSREFAEQTGLFNNRIRKILSVADEKDFVCSMPMFGNGIFSVISPDRVSALLKIFHKFGSSDQIIVSKIDFEGAMLL